jgi:hypothetical protein
MILTRVLIIGDVIGTGLVCGAILGIVEAAVMERIKKQ